MQRALRAEKYTGAAQRTSIGLRWRRTANDRQGPEDSGAPEDPSFHIGQRPYRHPAALTVGRDDMMIRVRGASSPNRYAGVLQLMPNITVSGAVHDASVGCLQNNPQGRRARTVSFDGCGGFSFCAGAPPLQRNEREKGTPARFCCKKQRRRRASFASMVCVCVWSGADRARTGMRQEKIDVPKFCAQPDALIRQFKRVAKGSPQHPGRKPQLQAGGGHEAENWCCHSVFCTPRALG